MVTIKPLFLVLLFCSFVSILSAQEIKYQVSGNFNRLNPEHQKLQAYLIQTESNIYKIDSDICTDCGTCADVCPVEAIHPA